METKMEAVVIARSSVDMQIDNVNALMDIASQIAYMSNELITLSKGLTIIAENERLLLAGRILEG